MDAPNWVIKLFSRHKGDSTLDKIYKRKGFIQDQRKQTKILVNKISDSSKLPKKRKLQTFDNSPNKKPKPTTKGKFSIKATSQIRKPIPRRKKKPIINKDTVDLFTVETVTATKWNIVTNKQVYKVKWLGYPDHESTWELTENLEDNEGSNEVFLKFLKNRPKITTPLAVQYCI